MLIEPLMHASSPFNIYFSPFITFNKAYIITSGTSLYSTIVGEFSNTKTSEKKNAT